MVRFVPKMMTVGANPVMALSAVVTPKRTDPAPPTLIVQVNIVISLLVLNEFA